MDILTGQQIKPFIHIRPSKGISINFREIWEYRELIYFFIWRHLKARYKQTTVGVAWVIIQPLFAMVVFSVIFGKFAKLPSDGLPYPIFSYAALLPWGFFSIALTRSCSSIVENSNLISKIYFPRLILPLASALSCIIDFAISFVILLIMMIYYQVSVKIAIITIPLFLFLAFMTALSVGLWFSAISAQYRDAVYVMNFFIQIWLYASPVAYSSSVIPEKWRFLYGLNPMAGVIEGFRWALLGTAWNPGHIIIVSSIIVVILFTGGLFFFRHMEKTMADVL